MIKQQLPITDDSAGAIEDDDSFSYQAFLDMLEEAYQKVPVEFRESAKIEFSLHGDYVSGYMNLCFERPLTAEELQADEDRQKRRAAERERTERIEYERLKRKFGA